MRHAFQLAKQIGARGGVKAAAERGDRAEGAAAVAKKENGQHPYGERRQHEKRRAGREHKGANEEGTERKGDDGQRSKEPGQHAEKTCRTVVRRVLRL